MVVVKVPCQRCDKGKLERFLGDEVDGWMCSGARKFQPGEGCGTLVENAEYRELLAEAQPPPPPEPARPPKRQKNDAAGTAMDEDGGEAAEGDEGGGSDNDEEFDARGFDAIDDQVVDVRVARPMVVRREAACELLSLSEVDKVLRGAFVAPGGSDARQLRGLLPRCLQSDLLGSPLRVECGSRAR